LKQSKRLTICSGFLALNSFNEDGVKNQATNLAEMYSNRGNQLLSLTRNRDEMFCSPKIGLPMQRTSNFHLSQRLF